jgi:DNA repair exonuclease SbcCD nuclease subunit
MRLLLFSDLHLERPFRWASTEVGQARRRNLRTTLQRIVELAGSQNVDALCCGGDLYEHEGFAPDTMPFLVATFASVSPIPVLLAPGNHDPCLLTSIYQQARWSGNVTVFDEPSFRPFEITSGFTVWGAGHVHPAGTPDPLTGVRVDREGCNVALFHGSEQGTLAFQGADKEPHAPFRAEEITAAGFDFAMLGHFHRPQITATFVYPGNPDPLEFGEEGRRGPALIDVDDSGRIDVQIIPVAVSKVATADVDLSGITHLDEAQERVRAALAGCAGTVRLTLSGEVPAEVDVTVGAFSRQVVAAHLDALPVRFSGLRAAFDFDALANQPTVEGQFVRDVRSSGLDDDEQRRVLLTGLRALAGRTDLAVET